MINLRVSMNVTFEVFVKGFRLIFLPLKTDSIWVQTPKPRVLKQFFLTVPAGDNFGLEAHFSRLFGQDCHKCKHELWRLLIELSFDMPIFKICTNLRSKEDLAWLMGDSNVCIRGRRFGPSYPCCTMTCPLKGRSVYMNIEGLGWGFRLRYLPF